MGEFVGKYAPRKVRPAVRVEVDDMRQVRAEREFLFAPPNTDEPLRNHVRYIQAGFVQDIERHLGFNIFKYAMRGFFALFFVAACFISSWIFGR